MISKDFLAIGWADILRLIETQREEDDTIEFKSGFKGGSNFLVLNDKSREQAIDAVAREVIAFLNTRGGDVVIGLAENEGAPPVASVITPVDEPAEVADRVARSLAAVIEPSQTNLIVRSIVDPENGQRGLILIRVQPSLRAPHRSKRTREAYARRGSEAVPMAMDEIQDLTINRTRLRLEQLEVLDQQFDDFRAGRIDQRQLGSEVLHVRVTSLPFLEQNIAIDSDTLLALGNSNPAFFDAKGRKNSNDVAFRGLYSNWKPILRGRKQESYDEHGSGEFPDFQYASKRIKTNGITAFDYAAVSRFSGQGPMVHFDWLIGFLAQVSDNIKSLNQKFPTILPCTIRVAFRSIGGLNLTVGRTGWQASYEIPTDTFFIPDFTIASLEDLDNFFYQCQIDFASLVGMNLKDPYTLSSSIEEGKISSDA